MKQENKEKWFLAGTTILMIIILVIVLFTIKEIPPQAPFSPWMMTYPPGSF